MAKEPENRIQLRIDSDASLADHFRRLRYWMHTTPQLDRKSLPEIGLSKTLSFYNEPMFMSLMLRSEDD
jgi:hypothetical protein